MNLRGFSECNHVALSSAGKKKKAAKHFFLQPDKSGVTPPSDRKAECRLSSESQKAEHLRLSLYRGNLTSKALWLPTPCCRKGLKKRLLQFNQGSRVSEEARKRVEQHKVVFLLVQARV